MQSSPSTLFNIVLNAPDIPGNTGSIGRTCLALNLRLILIKPYGFELSEKAVRRAGLDYWQYVALTEYNSYSDFFSQENPSPSQLFFFTKLATQTHYKANFSIGSYLIFGSETKGLPPTLLQQNKSQSFCLPMFSEHIRSLNLANAATAVAYEALRQIQFS